MPQVLSEFGHVIGVSNVDVQTAVLPTTTSYPVGQIVQYIGSTTSSYTQGFFYKQTATNVWTQLDTQPASLNTNREIDVNGVQVLSSDPSSGLVNFKNGSNVTITASGSTIQFDSTDQSVTSVNNHYIPTGTETKSASGGTVTNIANSTSGSQVVSGVTVDAAGHVTGVTSISLTASNTTYAPATTSVNGLLSSNDKGKIDKLTDTMLDMTSDTATGNPLSFTTDSAQVAQNTVITFEPIQAGSGDPSPSNVREIEGYVKAKLQAVKKNVWGNGITADNGDKKTDNYLGWRIPYTSNMKIQLIDKNNGADISGCYLGLFVDPDNVLEATWILSNGIINVGRNPMTTSTFKYICIFPNDATTLNKIFARFDIITVVDDDSLTPFEPYNPLTDISEQLPTTIYGGTLDVESGELVVDRVRQTLNGTETWYYQESQPNWFYTVLGTLTAKQNVRTAICDTYKYAADPRASSMSNGEFICNTTQINNNNNFGCINTGYSDLASWKAYLAEHNINYVYELATPITYHLTPHQVKLLQGANTVTTNGTSIALTYRKGEVAKLSDLNGIAESVEGLGEIVKDNAIKRVTFSDTTGEFGIISLYSRGYTKDNIVNAFASTGGSILSFLQIYTNSSNNSFVYLKVTDTNMTPVLNTNVEVTVLYI